MKKEYGPDSEREYTAPEAPRIVEPEPSLPQWIKGPIFYLVLSYLAINLGGFLVTNQYRIKGMSKSKIEEIIDKNNRNAGDLAKFVFDDLAKPGRKLAYRIHGEKEQEK